MRCEQTFFKPPSFFLAARATSSAILLGFQKRHLRLKIPTCYSLCVFKGRKFGWCARRELCLQSCHVSELFFAWPPSRFSGGKLLNVKYRRDAGSSSRCRNSSKGRYHPTITHKNVPLFWILCNNSAEIFVTVAKGILHFGISKNVTWSSVGTFCIETLLQTTSLSTQSCSIHEKDRNITVFENHSKPKSSIS